MLNTYDIADTITEAATPKSFVERWFDFDTFTGRLRTILAPIIYLCVCIFGTMLMYNFVGNNAGLAFCLISVYSCVWVPALIQAGYWIWTGKPKWDW